jgi:hypothetical protein
MVYRLTPDGRRYLSMARGEREPVPFHLRWLLPWALSENVLAWVIVNIASVLAIGALTALLALQYGVTLTQAIVAGLLMLGLPSIRFAWFSPVLVDMLGLALALGAAVTFPISPWAALGVCVLGAMISEKVPVFSLQPILLAGLVAPLARYVLVSAGEIRSDDQLAWTLDLRRAGLKAHAGKWRAPAVMLLPWGACLIVVAAAPSPWLLLALLVGYAQLLVATDSVRLYQQAAPVVCIMAATLIPEAWAVPVLLAHWFNPFMGGGI